MYCPSSAIVQIGLRTLDCIKAIELSFGTRKDLNTLIFFIYSKLTAFIALKFAKFISMTTHENAPGNIL